jgi:hypothetical protein
MFNRRNYYGLLALWGIIYIIGTINAPLAPNRFNLSTTSTHLLQVTIALPVVLIWTAAVIGAERFKSYTQRIIKHPDGEAMNKVANGLIILVAALLFRGVSGILRPWALKDGWLDQFTILYNFISVVLPLIAYCFMYAGSKDLLKLTKSSKKYLMSWLPVILLIIAVGILYITVIFHYGYRNNTPDPAKFSSFYLTDGLIFFTLLIPYLAGWALGIKSALNINAYKRDVKGAIYKNALFRLVIGFLLVIACAVTIQLLVAFSTYFATAKLASILLFIYLLLIFYASGFLFIASGTKKLGTIEMVK